MRFKTPLKWSWLVISVAIVALSSAGVFSLTSSFSPPDSGTKIEILAIIESPQNPIADKLVEQIQNSLLRDQVISELPIRLKIPKINVDANIESVGLTSLGAMDAPKGPTGAAWFSLGPRPGEEGSAVISGHYGWKNNIPAVFDALHKLQKGDKIYVEDKKGTTITFVVRELRSYGEKDEAWEVFSSSDDRAHLNLVTCEGTWNKANKSYSSRLVVFSDAL